MRYIIATLLYIALCRSAIAQQADSTIIANMDSTNKVSFSIALPPLTQIPGAPEPFYTYLWDFGDGHFSTAESPEHIYAKEGVYDVYLYAVNNYDDGKKPQRKKQRVEVKKPAPPGSFIASAAERDFFKANGIFELKYNCMAKPDDTMVLIAGWRNTGPEPVKGRFYLLLNEKQFEQTCFDTSEFRSYDYTSPLMAYNKDTDFPFALQSALLVTESGSPASNFSKTVEAEEASSLLSSTFSLYKSVFTADVRNIDAGQTAFSFLQLYVTPDMLKDTNATLTITGVYVPEKGQPVMHKLNIPVVNSHDPNKMNIKGGRISYRFLKKYKPLHYKVRFQNNGKGPARKIALDIDLAPVLNPETIQITDMSPFCPPCDSLAAVKRGCWELQKKENGAIFTFHGIYLPGTNQKGVEDKDSTKGFLEFSVVTRKKLENKPFKSRTAIYFDKNEPVITNYATGRFKKSPSPIFMAGYEKAFGNDAKVSDGIVTGIGIAPLAPYLPYFQTELYYKAAVRTTTTRISVQEEGSIFIDSLMKRLGYDRIDSLQTTKISQIKLIPLQLRYNINDYISIGAGAVVTADIAGEIEGSKTYHLLVVNDPNAPRNPYTLFNKEKIKAFSNWRARPFFDLQLGKVKLGPHIGFRYYYNGKNSSFGYFYAGWRL
ncbi:PKD domain-containing protein [Niabella digestorum]|uniref:PKD domain-containing protein n=1 Tax=Niabella digestorum TaxID=3117701 RepID=A0ABU7RH97_9BACT